jgi:hypothetical protein
MGQLDAQRRLLRLVPQADVVLAHAAGRLHRRRLQDDEARAGHREVPVVHQVPVIGAIFGIARILRHGRDDDAVGQRQPAQVEGREDACGHAGIPCFALPACGLHQHAQDGDAGQRC